MSSEAVPDRIGMLDTTRGIAVLGILLMNITGFGLPNAYDDPTIWGNESAADLTVWRIMSLLFEGTMRGLFTILFGASALLFLQKHATKFYFARTLWLIVFGLVNGYLLLWSGDVLYFYGVIGLVLFFFRKLSVRNLLVIAAVMMVMQTLVSVVEWRDYESTRAAAVLAAQKQVQGQLLSAEEQQVIEDYTSMREDMKPPHYDLQETVDYVRDSYASAFSVFVEHTWYMETDFFLRHGMLDALGMMLIGMALLKNGVLTGAASTRTYGCMIVIGYALGLSVNTWEMTTLEAANFSPSMLMRSFVTYDLGRIPMTLGHIGMIALLCRSVKLEHVSRLLASVGQMALTNYLSQSLICLFVFTGAGLALYGQLARHELYYIVFAIWGVQLLWSPLWLKRFRQGPAEWIWRTLTYFKRQKLLR